uniref:Uncharacterized protein n=1 Tax=Arundo donax TaxID=35708 RepID=A0A0A8ZBI2_ARUDO
MAPCYPSVTEPYD